MREENSGARNASMRVRGFLGACATLAIAGGGILVAASVAEAAQPANCSVYAGTPYKNGTNIRGQGKGTCSAAKDRRFLYQIHRSQGFWHPTVLQKELSGSRKDYVRTIEGCDTGSGSNSFKYFGQSFFVGYTPDISVDSASYKICG